jgi:hypothetical protein
MLKLISGDILLSLNGPAVAAIKKNLVTYQSTKCLIELKSDRLIEFELFNNNTYVLTSTYDLEDITDLVCKTTVCSLSGTILQIELSLVDDDYSILEYQNPIYRGLGKRNLVLESNFKTMVSSKNHAIYLEFQLGDGFQKCIPTYIRQPETYKVLSEHDTVCHNMQVVIFSTYKNKNGSNYWIMGTSFYTRIDIIKKLTNLIRTYSDAPTLMGAKDCIKDLNTLIEMVNTNSIKNQRFETPTIKLYTDLV